MNSPWVSATTLLKIPYKRGNSVTAPSPDIIVSQKGHLGKSQSQVDKGIFVWWTIRICSMGMESIWYSIQPLWVTVTSGVLE
jgi:nitrous oxidase accessory protein NosD